ncbi:MAG: tRNA pseudouridine(55) synthase TruB [Blastocatellia bacterium]
MNETKPNQMASSADGVLIIDKPAGMTSHDVVARVRKILKTRRVGHTGTLDPFATGVLVVCVGRATRLSQFLTGDDKEYLATMRLGFATDTGDLTGQPLEPLADARHITPETVEDAMELFRGRIQQTPPMYSAKKVGGVKLYEMARRGEEIERTPVEVEIKELELSGTTEIREDLTRDFSFRVVSSSGTYIRTLAEDIGRRLGVGAHLVALRRTRAGNFGVERAQTPDKLAESATVRLIPMADALSFPTVQLNEEEGKAVRYGRSVLRHGNWRGGNRAKLCDINGELVAIADLDPENCVWRPIVVL